MTAQAGSSSLCFGAAILAAGASTRMAQPKMLLPWGPTSIIGHLTQQWQALGAKHVAVVCAKNDHALQAELERIGCSAKDRIINTAPHLGMFSSIRCAAGWPGWNSDLTHWIIVLGDQPHLQVGTLRALIEFGAAHPEQICQPIRLGHPRHPILFPERAWQRLCNAGQEDLKQFLKARSAERGFCEIDDPGLDLDIDRPLDYQEAMKLFLSGG
jgi:molybdenum cofactor cytidylyltransferase